MPEWFYKVKVKPLWLPFLGGHAKVMDSTAFSCNFSHMYYIHFNERE